MPEFKISTSDGRVITINAVQKPTPQEALSIVSKLTSSQGKTTEPAKDPRNQTFGEFKIQERINSEKSLGEDALDFAGGVASGIGQIFSMGVGAVGETIEAVSDGEFKKILKSFPEGVAKSMFDLGEIGEAIGGRIGDQFVGDEESLMRQFQRQQQDFVDSDKRQAGLVFGADETLPQLSEIASIVGDPTNLIGLGVAGKLAKASKLGKTAQRAGEILDLPNKAIRAGLGKAVKGGALGAGTVLKALDKPLKGVSVASAKVAELARRPRSVVQEITEKTLGIKPGNLGAVSKVGFMMGGPIGKILLGAELVGSKGANLYKNSVDAQKMAHILAKPDGKLSFLQQVATHPDISEGIRRLANLSGTQKGMDIAMNAVSNGVSAGILQGIFTKLATDDLGQIGQAVGGGLAVGGLAPVGPKTIRGRGGEPRQASSTDLPVSLDPAQRARDIEALERERQANPKKFNAEKQNMFFFIPAFGKKPTDAGMGLGKEGTTIPAGAKELYYARDEIEGVSNINKIEGLIQDDLISNITYVKTGAGSTSTSKKIKGSEIGTIVQDIALLDFQITSGDKTNRTLTSARGINTDVLRELSVKTNVDMDVLLTDLSILKQYVRSGGKVNDSVMKGNSIVGFLDAGEKGLLVQVEPRNIVSIRNKPLDTAINAPFVAPDTPQAPINPLDSPVLAPDFKPTPATLKNSSRESKARTKGKEKSKEADVIKNKRDENANIPDFRGNSVMTQPISLGANGHINAKFRRGVDKSLYHFANINKRKTSGKSINQKSNVPDKSVIEAEQRYLADIYNVEFKDVPALAKRFNDHVKSKAKAENKKDRADFRAPPVKDFI